MTAGGPGASVGASMPTALPQLRKAASAGDIGEDGSDVSMALQPQ